MSEYAAHRAAARSHPHYNIADMILRFDFPVEVVRTDRKRSIAIHIEREIVKVRVPRALADWRVREFIVRRTPWIKTKLKELSERPPIRPKEYVSGEGFAYLGKNYRLKVLKNEEDSSVKLKDGYLRVSLAAGDARGNGEAKDKAPGNNKTRAKARANGAAAANSKAKASETGKAPESSDAPIEPRPLAPLIRSLLVSWYTEHATERLREKTRRYARIIGVEPKSVSVREYKARWGSCSPKGEISYNWRIILAPHSVIDYVVIHELCHMLEHNHSRRYWRHVETHCPNWREHREWLKQNPLVV